ncbi:MAG: SDR family oxidoreductase [Candidatus Saccharibacteria bacterium]|nr:SDR family oxidoreductase [Candidatus Saccharibacteria bacterium]
MKVKNKVFVVTGAGGGIGGALVDALLARGAEIAAVDVKEENLQKHQGDKRVSIHAVDITDKKAVAALPKSVIAAHGRVDGVVNNAGIIQPFVKVNDLKYEAIEKVMNVNFYGTLYVTKAFLPHLLDRSEAYVVNVSSMGGFLPVPGQSVYGASKAAVKLLTEGLYAELLNTDVRVSIVFPGATDTNISENSGVKAPGGAAAEEAKKKFKALPADKAAEIIVRGIEKNKPQIFTGKDSTFMNRLYRFKPVFATKFIAKQMKSLLD